MSRIANCFTTLKEKKQTALVTFITAGDPNYQTSLSLLQQLPSAGADIIELGMPFTDPMADGPTIQKASLRALKNGQTLLKVLEMVATFRQNNQHTPIVLMGYFNPIHHFGVKDFTKAAKQAGVDGLIIVDLPAEHDADLCIHAQSENIDFIRLATPTTDDHRLPRVLNNSSGFVYYVSVAGITGTGSATNDQIKTAIERLHRHTSLPICVGFGIKTTEQARNIAKLADGVVVGSAFVSLIENAETDQIAINNVLSLCHDLSDAIKTKK